jgi:hypothetical protein
LIAADTELLTEPQLRAMHARLDARLFTPKRTSRALSFAVVFASAVLGFVAVQSLAPTLPEVVGGFEVKPAPETHAQVTREAMVELTADATVVDTARGVTIHSLTRSTVRREARGTRLLEGKASFDVTKRTEGVVRVLVSGGSIEVHGTRFTVFDDGAARARSSCTRASSSSSTRVAPRSGSRQATCCAGRERPRRHTRRKKKRNSSRVDATCTLLEDGSALIFGDRRAGGELGDVGYYVPR